MVVVCVRGVGVGGGEGALSAEKTTCPLQSSRTCIKCCSPGDREPGGGGVGVGAWWSGHAALAGFTVEVTSRAGGACRVAGVLGVESLGAVVAGLATRGGAVGVHDTCRAGGNGSSGDVTGQAATRGKGRGGGQWAQGADVRCLIMILLRTTSHARRGQLTTKCRPDSQRQRFPCQPRSLCKRQRRWRRHGRCPRSRRCRRSSHCWVSCRRGRGCTWTCLQ